LRRTALAALIVVSAGGAFAYSITQGTPAALDSEGTESGHVGEAFSRSELVVVTVNAHALQPREGRLRALSDAIVRRAVNGREGIGRPDVVLLQETEREGVELLAEMLNERFGGSAFTPSGPLGRDIKSKFIVDTSTNEARPFRVWTDACDARNSYLALRLRRRSDGVSYIVAGVHIPWNASMECRVRNMLETRDVLGGWDGPAVVGGDFNQRAVELQRECDPDERSGALAWWASLTTQDEPGPGFVDAARAFARRRGRAIGAQWTYEGVEPTKLCNGTTDYRRNRIDYIFVSDAPGVRIVAAGADDPGWAGEDPGTLRCAAGSACRYSDHRFVWARIAI
jgi:endonuclease/exonuclease/phosphatase family metal-dependent hydrolase